jgi:hypothetical protein
MIVTNVDFRYKFRDLITYGYTREGGDIIFDIYISDYDAREISHSSSVSFHLHQGKFIGFYNQDGIYDHQHFFTSNDDFQTYEINELPYGSEDISIFNVFGNTLIVYRSYDGYGRFFKSIDGGESWERYSSSGTYLTTADFINPDKGWIFNFYLNSLAGNKANIYEFWNGETNKIASIDGHIVNASHFENENEGYIFTSTYTSGSGGSPDNNLFRFKTTDGGITWDSTNQITDFCTIKKFIAVSAGKYIVIRGSFFNNFDYYYFTESYGFNWWKKNIELQSSERIMDICFINSTTGYLKAGNSDSYGHIYKTTNGGTSWVKISQNPQPGNQIYYENESSGILTESHGGYDNLLYATNNGGVTWREVLYEYNFHY